MEGFAREDRLDIPVSAPTRNYRDRSHKPELLVAPARSRRWPVSVPSRGSVEFLRALAVPELDPFVNLLSGQSDADGLRALFTTWITAPQADLDVLVPAVLDGAVNYLRSGATTFAAEAKTTLQLGELYPGDAGVLASMLLNRITLAPGEGIYLPAGNLHAYLHGMGFEVMANSDNVLRGGLTPKHVDVPELLRVLDFTPADESAFAPAVVDRRHRTRLRDAGTRVRGVRAAPRGRPNSATRSMRPPPRRAAGAAVHRGLGARCTRSRAC